VCHALLQNPNFFHILLQIDIELAANTHASPCPHCGGTLHCANYPRKPRCCLEEARTHFESRFSFCCNQCRKRKTSVSVRFLGRRVYLGLAVVLMSARRSQSPSDVAQLSETLSVPASTLQRWRRWWVQQFPITPLWQAHCARFMPQIDLTLLPDSLIERFLGSTEDQIRRLLIFLSPLTVERPLTLNEDYCSPAEVVNS
jgi:hypothetical protein